MLKVTPNFHFRGQGRQAIELYKQAFGAEVGVLLCNSDANTEFVNGNGIRGGIKMKNQDKNTIIKNIADIAAKPVEAHGASFNVKIAATQIDMDTCAVSFVEIPPGEQSWPYHYHDQSEEIFYIISGQGKLRCYQGEKDIKAGDILCFPTGERGGHSITNTSQTEPLIYVDFEVKATKTDIVTMPDDGTYELIGNHLSWTTVQALKSSD